MKTDQIVAVYKKIRNSLFITNIHRMVSKQCDGNNMIVANNLHQAIVPMNGHCATWIIHRYHGLTYQETKDEQGKRQEKGQSS